MNVNATITKADIGKCAARYGCTNAKPFGDATPGTLRYETFAGAINPATGRYEGAHRFRVTPASPDAASYDFSKLPGVKT